jgi:HEAT repeat protein
VPLQFLTLVVLAVAATTLSVITSIALIVRKTVDRSRARTRERLYKFYSGRCSALLLSDLPALPSQSKPSRRFQQYESLIEPIKKSVVSLSRSTRRVHREALRHVLIDFAQDITGESSDRLVYFFYSFGFVEEEIELMGSRRWWTRAQAAHTMGLLGARKAITVLTGALEDPHPYVRNQATQSLIKLVGPDALKTIFRISRNLSRWTAIELSVIVGRFREAAEPHLIEALESRDQSVVLFATEMLGEIGFVSAVPPLMTLIRTSSNTVIQGSAVQTLGRLGDARARALITELVGSRGQFVRLKAIEALGRIGGEGAVEILKPHVAGRTFEESVIAARALAATGVRGIEMLRKMKSSEDLLIAGIAGQVIEEVGAEETGA